LSVLFLAIERQISVRSTREELIRRGILKDVDVDEENQLPATTAAVGDTGTVLGERICSVLLSSFRCFAPFRTMMKSIVVVVVIVITGAGGERRRRMMMMMMEVVVMMQGVYNSWKSWKSPGI